MGETRRRFLDWFLGTTMGALAAAVLYPVIRYLSPPEAAEAAGTQVEAGLSNDPAFVEDGFTITRLGGDPVIVVRAGAGDFRALAATCTHLECIVEYRKDQHLVWCNCHDGRFNLAGQVVGGPPPRPLETFQVNLVPSGEPGVDKVVVSRS